jgi:hypothetical protein
MNSRNKDGDLGSLAQGLSSHPFEDIDGSNRSLKGSGAIFPYRDEDSQINSSAPSKEISRC